MRALTWIAGIAAGIALVLIVTAFIGNRDRSGETVSAGQWAQTVCGAVGVWRSELRTIVKGVRQSPAYGGSTEEPQSQTRSGRSGTIRQGLDRAVRATETMVTGIDNAGTPDTPRGDEAARSVSDWADESLDELEDAQDALDSKPETIEEALRDLGTATSAIGSTLASGVRTMASVTAGDPQLAAAFAGSSTCRQMRKKEQSS